jgi:hypothetical protein
MIGQIVLAVNPQHLENASLRIITILFISRKTEIEEIQIFSVLAQVPKNHSNGHAARELIF